MKLNHLKKTCIALALVGATVVSLASCSMLPNPKGERWNNVKIDDLMLKRENQNGAGQVMEELDAVAGVPSAVSGDLLLTVETDAEKSLAGTVYRVYNLELSKKLVEVTGELTVGFVSTLLQEKAHAAGLYYIVNAKDSIMYIYNSDGTQAIASYYDENNPLVLQDRLNGFSFNGTDYYVKDGSVVFEGDNPLESEYFNASVEYLGRHYYLKEGELIFAFDKDGKPIYEFHRPSYAEDTYIHVLGNGNIFIQYIYETVEGEEYDYIRNHKQHKIVSILVNVERSTVTEPVIGYIVTDMENAFTADDFHKRYTDRVNNVAQITDISNKRIDENTQARYVVLSDGLIELFAMQEVVKGALDIIRISENRNLVKMASANLLVAGDCTVIGQLNNYRCITEKYIVTSGTIFDHDLKPIFNLTEEGYTFHTAVGDNVILSKIVSDKPCLYLFKGGNPIYLCEPDKFVSCFEGYAIAVADGYRYYDETGKLLLTCGGLIHWIDYREESDGRIGHVGYARDAEGNVTYYRLYFYEVDTLT